MTTPALFYFHEHSEYTSELGTAKLRSLIDRSDIIFWEFTSPDLEWTGKVEQNWNECIRRHDLSSIDYAPLQGLFLVRQLQGTSLRLKLEQSLPPPYYPRDLRLEATLAFFDSTLPRAYQIYDEFLSIDLPYHAQREQKVAAEIVSLPETVTIVFGCGHLDMVELIQRERPVEIHYPYDNYPESCEIKLRQNYMQTGRLEKELYHQAMAESIVMKAIQEITRKYNPHEGFILANYYSQRFASPQIIALRDEYLRAHEERSSTIGPVFKKFLERQSLPSILESAALILDAKI
ncbi:MAG: hypothetical protein Q7K45_06565 [Nanoarchaeota archaeon]|nr:hypothetical protein [Nanoarchaeota archaeon]